MAQSISLKHLRHDEVVNHYYGTPLQDRQHASVIESALIGAPVKWLQ
jgi:hypothetical protein